MKSHKTLYAIIVGLAVLCIGLGISVYRSKHYTIPSPSAEHVHSQKFTCPMHPQVVSDKPGSCPICHMDLVPQEEDTAQKKSTEPQSTLDDRATVTLSQQKQQLIGITTQEATVRSLTSVVRATGRVAFDPELYSAVEEYRQAAMTQRQMKANPYSELRTQSEQLVKSAKTKLKLMGLGEEQIAAITPENATEGSDSNSFSLLLPNGKVWIYAEVFEYEVSALKRGQKVEVESPATPGKTFFGTISSISPVVNNPTRTVRVRAEVPDPNGLLRPDTFVSVKIAIDHGKRLAVPEDSVLQSGNQSFVFVSRDEGRFEPRVVKTGIRTSAYYEIISGVKVGETVVTAANFLIDSESRLKSAIQNMGSEAKPTHGDHAK